MDQGLLEDQIEAQDKEDQANAEGGAAPASDTDAEGGTEVNGEATGGSQARDRSTIRFPYIDLDAASELPTVIFNSYGGKCAADQLAAMTGHGGTRSGAFARKIAGAQTFGLIAREGDNVLITDLGRMIVTGDARAIARGKAQAFLSVELYGRLYSHFRGGTMPPDEGLRATMRDMGVAPKATEAAKQVFRRSAEQAGFFAHGKDRLIAPPALSDAPGGATTQAETLVVEPEGSSDTSNQENALLRQELADVKKQMETLKNGQVSAMPNLPPAVTGVLTTLPLSAADQWTDEDLDEWVTMFRTVIKRSFRDRITVRPSSTNA